MSTISIAAYFQADVDPAVLVEDIDSLLRDLVDEPEGTYELSCEAMATARETLALRINCDAGSGDPTLDNTLLDSVARFVLECDGLQQAIVTHDSRVVEENARAAADLYRIENRVREALTTVVLLFSPHNSLTNLLAGSTVSVNKDTPNEGELSERFENEFWYLSFSDYKRVGDVKLPSSAADLVRLLQRSSSIEDVQAQLSPQLEVTGPGGTLLAKLQEPLESVEKARNAIAHNRSLSGRVRQNMARAVPVIEAALDDFEDELRASTEAQSAAEF